jgi:hypothetical protein
VFVGVAVFDEGSVAVCVGVDVFAEERVGVRVADAGVFVCVGVRGGTLVEVGGFCVDVLDARTTAVNVGKFVTLGVTVAPKRGVAVGVALVIALAVAKDVSVATGSPSPPRAKRKTTTKMPRQRIAR